MHGDDFVTEGPVKQLRWLDEQFKKRLLLNTEVLGDGVGKVPHVKVLNWLISSENGAIVWEADPRHIEILRDQMGLQAAGSVKTPAEKEPSGLVQFRKLDGDGTGRDGFDMVDAAFALERGKECRSERPSSGIYASASDASFPIEHMRKASGPNQIWADSKESDHALPEIEVSAENRRRAELSAEGWHEGSDGRWRRHF